MNRRSLLKGAAAVLGLGLGGLVGGEAIEDAVLKRNPPAFNQIYEQAGDFVDAYNDNSIPRFLWTRHRLKESLDAHNLGLEPQNWEDVSNFFIENNKVFYRAEFDNLGVPEFILGNVQKKWSERFENQGKTLEYKVILFAQDNDTLLTKRGKEENTAFWDEQTKTVFVNMTQVEKTAEMLYAQCNQGFEGSSFYYKMVSEFCGLMMELAKANPFFSKNPIGTFKEEFAKFAVQNAIKHERGHSMYPEGGIKEYIPFVCEIAENPELNSYTFIIANKKNYPLLYHAFSSKGYGEEQIATMSPQARANLAKEILKKK